MTEPVAPRIDTSRPHPARMYDWFLGGKDNYPVDEELGLRILAQDPQAKYAARSNRWFMRRATRLLVRETGIRQFLDVGTGIPTEPNLHQIAQETAPDARVVYVDNDPLVLAHARALLVGTPEGLTRYLHADIRDVDSLGRAPAHHRLLGRVDVAATPSVARRRAARSQRTPWAQPGRAPGAPAMSQRRPAPRSRRDRCAARPPRPGSRPRTAPRRDPRGRPGR